VIALLIAGLLAIGYFFFRKVVAPPTTTGNTSGTAGLDTQISINQNQLTQTNSVIASNPDAPSTALYLLNQLKSSQLETQNILAYNKMKGFAPTTINEGILNATPNGKDPPPPGKYWDYTSMSWQPLLG
jgi:hypothetical protein